MALLFFKEFLASAILAGPFAGLLLFTARSSRLDAPRYLLEVRIEPAFENDWQNLIQLLLPLAKEAGAYIEQRDQRIFIQAMDNLVVESIANALKAGSGMKFKLGIPEVFYRFRGLLSSGDLMLWEPVMKVEVAAPKRSAEEIGRALRNRRGQRLTIRKQGGALCITAFVPLEEMFGFGDALQAISQGQASYTVTFDCFSPLPPNDHPPKRPAVIRRI